MSIMKSAKEFFGLAPVDMEQDDAYYADDARYGETQGAVAYAPRRDYADYQPEPEPYAATIVPVDLRSYTEATLIGEPFRDGDAVVFDLTRMDNTEAKRIIDFAAGLCFALRGQMKKLDKLVFAVVPENAAVATIDLERAARLR
ncbi:cell division protein SepF [Corynebacterium halotolerans]|uniref:cell division protein SepF n=1 Tax=Corynebacterium halotolerans TaxID=225326 RepID=UPI003CEA0585